MGCNDRDFETSQADLDRIAAEKDKAVRITALCKSAEETWVRFIKNGLSGITQKELNEHCRRVEQNYVDMRRLVELDDEMKQLSTAIAERRNQCIHLTLDGKSAFEGDIYFFCPLCGDAR